MPYVTVDDFRLGQDNRNPAVAGVSSSLVTLKNAHITRGGRIQRAKKFVSTYSLPTSTAEVLATGRFAVTGGTASAGANQVLTVTVDGVDVLGAAVDWATSNAATATAVAAQITTLTSSVNYTATASGEVVTISAVTLSGVDPNALVISGTVKGDVTISGDPYWSTNTLLLLEMDGADAATTTTDTSLGAHTGFTFANSAQLDTAQKKFGTASLLIGASGSQDHLIIPDDADFHFGSGKFTMEVWVRFNAFATGSDTQAFVTQWPGGSNRSFVFNYNDPTNTLGLIISTTGSDLITAVSASWTPVLNTWYHVAVDRDASDDFRLYIDGVVLATNNETGALNNSTADVWIGDQESAGGVDEELDGWIDGVRITKGIARYAEQCNAASRLPVAAHDVSNTILNAKMDCGAVAAQKTFGLHAQGGNLFVFGGFTTPTGIPSDLTYQRLAHKSDPNGTQIKEILDTDNFDGKIYAIAEYTDNEIYHFYDGTRITSWDSVAAAVSSNNAVATSLKDKIDLNSLYDATVSTNVVTIEAATAGVAFTISASAQNFGVVNDQLIALAEVTPNGVTGSEVLSTGTVTVTGGSGNIASQGSVDLTGGGSGSVDGITVNSIEIMSGAENFDTNLSTTATNVASNITANTSSPDYNATANGTLITITALASAGADPNTFVVTPSSTTITTAKVDMGTVTLGVTNALTALTVDGVSIITNRVNDNTSNSLTATDIATEIGNTTSSPNYTAATVGGVVTITAIAGTGAGPNGFTVARTVSGNVTAGTTNMAGGSASTSAVKQKHTATITGTFEAQDVFTITLDGVEFTISGTSAGTGKTCQTFKSKIYSLVGSLLQFCALNGPTQWGSGIGSGFINFANQDGGSETLTATGIFQGNLGVFADDVVQIEFIDVDEALNTLLHTLQSTGTPAHRSAVQFGNNDLFYLDGLSGIRSLRARDSSNAPSVDDVGSAIDTHVLEHMDTLTTAQIAAAVAMIADEGRYWIAIGTRIYVFSFFPGNKISAWSYYEPGFSVKDMVRVKKKNYVRAGDTVFLYGGAAGTTFPDAAKTPVTATFPFMDVKKIANFKSLIAVDQSGTNTWDMVILIDPDDLTIKTTSVALVGTTYNDMNTGVTARTTHFAPEFTCNKAGAAELYTATIHYILAEAG